MKMIAAAGLVVLFGNVLGVFGAGAEAPRRVDEGVSPAAPRGGGSCSCPGVTCAQGTIAACSISCVDPRIPVCQCDAGCNSANGNTSGSNRCFCQ